MIGDGGSPDEEEDDAHHKDYQRSERGALKTGGMKRGITIADPMPEQHLLGKRQRHEDAAMRVAGATFPHAQNYHYPMAGMGGHRGASQQQHSNYPQPYYHHGLAGASGGSPLPPGATTGTAGAPMMPGRASLPGDAAAGNAHNNSGYFPYPMYSMNSMVPGAYGHQAPMVMGGRMQQQQQQPNSSSSTHDSNTTNSYRYIPNSSNSNDYLNNGVPVHNVSTLPSISQANQKPSSSEHISQDHQNHDSERDGASAAATDASDGGGNPGDHPYAPQPQSGAGGATSGSMIPQGYASAPGGPQGQYPMMLPFQPGSSYHYGMSPHHHQHQQQRGMPNISSTGYPPPSNSMSYHNRNPSTGGSSNNNNPSAAGVPPVNSGTGTHSHHTHSNMHILPHGGSSAHQQPYSSAGTTSSFAASHLHPVNVTSQQHSASANNTATIPSAGGGIPLALPMDMEQLSDYQILVRQQLELFEATQTDVECNTQGRKKPILLSQVGLRCRHCATLPLRARGRGAVYYPAKLHGIYQAAQNMAGSHLCHACQQISPQLKTEIKRLRERRDNASGGKQYWADGCRALGLFETDHGLQMRTTTTTKGDGNSAVQEEEGEEKEEVASESSRDDGRAIGGNQTYHDPNQEIQVPPAPQEDKERENNDDKDQFEDTEQFGDVNDSS